MKNYICINEQKIGLDESQVDKLRAALKVDSVLLGTVAVAETVKIGEQEMVVLEQLNGATVLICKELYGENMEFGSSNNYEDSYVDCACETFADQLGQVIGEDNIIRHTVDLTSDDGLKDYGIVERRASLLTTEQYRKYVQTLDKHKLDAYWWLATPYSTPSHDHSSWVKCVSPSGSIINDGCLIGGGVRPFCILKSNIFVSK